MKQFKHIMLAVFCGLICSAALSSCGDDDKDEPKPVENTSGNNDDDDDDSGYGDSSHDRALVGTWYAVASSDANPTEYLIFQSDGVGYSGDDAYPSDIDRFTWSTSGHSLTIRFSDGYPERYTYSISGSRLYITYAEDGREYTMQYHRDD